MTSTAWHNNLVNQLLLAISSETLQAIAIGIQCLLWLVILFFPLKGVDRQDCITGASYVTFLAFCGLLLILAVSQRLASFHDIKSHLLVFLLLLGAAGLRWHYRPRRFVPPEIIDLAEDSANGR